MKSELAALCGYFSAVRRFAVYVVEATSQQVAFLPNMAVIGCGLEGLRLRPHDGCHRSTSAASRVCTPKRRRIEACCVLRARGRCIVCPLGTSDLRRSCLRHFRRCAPSSGGCRSQHSNGAALRPRGLAGIRVRDKRPSNPLRSSSSAAAAAQKPFLLFPRRPLGCHPSNTPPHPPLHHHVAQHVASMLPAAAELLGKSSSLDHRCIASSNKCHLQLPPPAGCRPAPQLCPRRRGHRQGRCTSRARCKGKAQV